ncbi:MAG: biosynthetic arginine decarboxylase [Verrucomicrobia bacterium]|nr:biosynthetic arginine decarboxylase [Verrucomicrobiota bacterium]
MNKHVNKNKKMYRIAHWGKDYFDINKKGHIVVYPGQKEKGLDLYNLVQSLHSQGVSAPLVIRFDGILKDRVEKICSSFHAAIDACGYRNVYQPIYPIKVNPKKHIVETIQKAGKKYGVGLEVGSKGELLASFNFRQIKGSLILCNGFKDEEYIELALLAEKLGHRCIIIVEQAEELELIRKIAKKHRIEPEVGFRMKLHAQGSGRWKSSGGDHSKFGLTATEIEKGLAKLKKWGKTDWLKLFHFHIGSQITSLSSIQKGLHEGAKMYVHLAKECPSLHYFDIGGGLAVDYQGTETSANFSVNYQLHEYAKTVISIVGSCCDKHGIAHPVILSESGRAMVAHHSILIAEILSSSENDLYFCNFSIFQSLPDSWAIGQIFPVLPICRLNEEPNKQVKIVDLTCDSDGKLDHFIQDEKPSDFLALHQLDSRPYYIGVFLAGAYQEILGARHNLFGNTNAVHIDLNQKGEWQITNEISSDNIKEMLRSIQCDPQALIDRISTARSISKKESAKLKRHFKNALNGHTYLKARYEH